MSAYIDELRLLEEKLNRNEINIQEYNEILREIERQGGEYND